jgi:hypothetical protein
MRVMTLQLQLAPCATEPKTGYGERVSAGRRRSEMAWLVRREVQIERNLNRPREVDLGRASFQLDACFQRARSITVPQFAHVRFPVLA